MIPEPPLGQGPIDPRNAFSSQGGAPQQPAAPPSGATMRPMNAPGVLPPPPFFPPPPPPRRRGAGWVVASVVLLCLLILSVVLNVVFGVSSLSGGSSREKLTVIHSGEEKQTIAVVPLEGEIDDKVAERFIRQMDDIDEDEDVRALVLRIDTPGGGVAASDEIYDRILTYKKKHTGVPVVVSMGSMATSGGYYASCAGDYLVAEHTTLTANIGVLMPSINVSELMKRYGVADATIVSTGATFKDVGSPLAPPTTRGTEYLQGIADSAFARFKDVVKTGRGTRLQGNIDQIADGRVYVADQAFAAGLIDEVGYLETAWQHAAASAKLNNPNVVRYDDNPSFLELLAGQVKSVAPGVSGRSGLRINGQDVNIDPMALDRALRPRLMYMWFGK